MVLLLLKLTVLKRDPRFVFITLIRVVSGEWSSFGNDLCWEGLWFFRETSGERSLFIIFYFAVFHCNWGIHRKHQGKTAPCGVISDWQS